MKTTPRKLEKLAEERETTVKDLIVNAIATEGSILAAAAALGVTANTIHHHKKRMGLVINRKTQIAGEVA